MTITLLAHHIEWDTDGDMDAARGLPSKLEVEVDLFTNGWVDVNKQICDQLSDKTGWCVLDYSLEGYSADADFSLQMSNAQSSQEQQGDNMSQSQFNAIMEKVKQIRQDGPMNDEAAYDTAAFILMDNPGLKDYIEQVIGAYDAQDWLADEI